MADMGFLPQVEWILRHIEREHQTLLFSATLDGAVDGLVRRYQTDPGAPRGRGSAGHRRRDDPPLPARPRDGQGQGGGGHRQRLRPHHHVQPHQARLPTGWPRKLQKEGVEAAAIHGDLRQNAAGEGAGRVHRRQAPGAGGHRRRRPWHPRRRRRRGHPLRPARRPQDLPAPLRAAPLAPAARVWSSPSCCGTRSSRSSACRSASASTCPIVEMFSNDERLADLAGWDPRRRRLTGPELPGTSGRDAPSNEHDVLHRLHPSPSSLAAGRRAARRGGSVGHGVWLG